FETRLVEWGAAFRDVLYLGCIAIDADDRVIQFGQASRGNATHVSEPEHRDRLFGTFHSCSYHRNASTPREPIFPGDRGCPTRNPWSRESQEQKTSGPHE